MGVAKVHVCCGVTVRASIGMLGLRMCGGEWGWGWCASAIPYCVRVLYM